jgi:hypothetical protein
LESFWLVTLHSTAAQVRGALKSVVDSDDAIAVIELKSGSNWASLATKPEGVEWLRTKISA